MKNESITGFYLEEVNKYTPKKDKVSVSSIHNHKDICFNSNFRETLYAIRDCFELNNASFSECAYGKAVCIPVTQIPRTPDFSNFNKYYKYYYEERLLLLVEDIPNKIIKYDIKAYEDIMNKDLSEAIIAKNISLRNYHIVKHLPQLPTDVNEVIRSYLIYGINDYTTVRDKFEQIRIQMTKYIYQTLKK